MGLSRHLIKIKLLVNKLNPCKDSVESEVELYLIRSSDITTQHHRSSGTTWVQLYFPFPQGFNLFVHKYGRLIRRKTDIISKGQDVNELIHSL